MADRLLVISGILFAVTGIGYMLVPGIMLGIVGIASAATSDFLIRTEGVALLCGAGVIWGARQAQPSGLRLVLLSLSAYLVIGAIVDLAAFVQGIVGVLSVPSAIVRIGLGAACLVAARRATAGPSATG